MEVSKARRVSQRRPGDWIPAAAAGAGPQPRAQLPALGQGWPLLSPRQFWLWEAVEGRREGSRWLLLRPSLSSVQPIFQMVKVCSVLLRWELCNALT